VVEGGLKPEVVRSQFPMTVVIFGDTLMIFLYCSTRRGRWREGRDDASWWSRQPGDAVEVNCVKPELLSTSGGMGDVWVTCVWGVQWPPAVLLWLLINMRIRSCDTSTHT